MEACKKLKLKSKRKEINYRTEAIGTLRITVYHLSESGGKLNLFEKLGYEITYTGNIPVFGLVAMERRGDEVVIRLHGGHDHCVTAPIYSIRRDHPLWIPHRYVQLITKESI